MTAAAAAAASTMMGRRSISGFSNRVAVFCSLYLLLPAVHTTFADVVPQHTNDQRQEGGQCKEGESHADCWWELKETKRTINATCADTRVIEAVQAKRPECWKECPVKEAENRTSACFLTCLFDTILGNATTGLKGMTRDEIVKPFEKAFSSAVPAEGGCSSVKPEPPAPPHPHPPSPPSYKCDGVGVATRASCTKPGIERPDATTCIAAGCCYDPENSPNCWKPKEV